MEEIETKVGSRNVYEVSALFVPELDAEGLSQTVDSLKQKLQSLEAEIISEGAPLHIRLAYTVEKHINNKIRRADYAHFYWVKFEVAPSAIAALEAFFKLDLNEKCLRHLLIRTVRENTVLTELTESKLEDIKNEELIDEVIGSELKDETEEAGVITDLGEDEPLVKEESDK